MKLNKQAQRNQCMDWIIKCDQSNPGQTSHTLNRLLESDINVSVELTKMSAKNLRILSAMMSVAYNTGSADSRKWFSEHRQAKSAPCDVAQLKLVRS